MSIERTIEALLAGAATAPAWDDRTEARHAARAAWGREVVAALKAAQERVDAAWARRLESLPDDIDDETLDDLPPPPEEAELDAIHAEIAAVRDHDRWPRHLYWGDI